MYNDTDIRRNRSATVRIDKMTSALESYLRKKISIKELKVVLEKNTDFSQSLWEDDDDYTEQNRVHEAHDQIIDKINNVPLEQSKRQIIAIQLKMPESSMLVGQVLVGEIAIDDAQPIADAIRNRHVNTAYDKLLELGYSKENARDMIKK